jgi:acyl-CoA dehydrogenase
MEGRAIYGEEHNAFRDMVRKFFAAEVMPNIAAWEKDGKTPRDFWYKCGAQGLLCPMAAPGQASCTRASSARSSVTPDR